MPVREKSSKHIEWVFQELDLDTEEKRNRLLRLSEVPEPRSKHKEQQIFIRSTNTTNSEEQVENA
jgi:hypothetical protein